MAGFRRSRSSLNYFSQADRNSRETVELVERIIQEIDALTPYLH
jgi:hypothetical protein